MSAKIGPMTVKVGRTRPKADRCRTSSGRIWQGVWPDSTEFGLLSGKRANSCTHLEGVGC